MTSIFSIQGAVVLFVMYKSRLDKLENYTEKGLKLTKKVENGWKKYFDQLLGARSTQKLVKIHNKRVSKNFPPGDVGGGDEFDPFFK